MAGAFEGDLSQISESQLAFIRQVLDKNGYHDAKVTFNRVGESGDNYLANVKRIVAEKDGETFKMIAKVAPVIEQLRAQMKTHDVFNNEYIMYSKVLPKFTQLERSVGIPENERLRYATCYGCLMDEPNELILLEDLQVAGFIMFDRLKPITDASIRKVLQSFAKLHALSYVLRQREPESFESFSNSLFNMWLNLLKDPFSKMYFQSIVKDSCDVLDEKKHKDVIIGVFSKINEILPKLNESDRNSKFSVIQQGDSWTNNLMFQVEEGTPVSCCMIDYQISKLNSPVADIHYLIFNCTDYNTRAKHFHDWIDYYHSELDNYLSAFGLKVNAIYPRDKLDADLRRHGKMSVIFTAMLCSTLIKKNDDAAKMKGLMEKVDFTDADSVDKILEVTSMANADEDTVKLYKTRVGGAIDSMLDFGLI